MIDQDQYTIFLKQRLEQIERLLGVKQHQINSLLDVTHAINNNFADEALFRIFETVMQAQFGVKKLALYVKEENWGCKVQYGSESLHPEIDVEKCLLLFDKFQIIQKDLHTDLAEYDYVIPVIQKAQKIAYALIGGLPIERDDPLEEKVKFLQTITNMVTVAIENKRLFAKELEQQAVSRDLELAAQMQNMLIPNSLPNDDQCEMAAYYLPHRDIGGDYYDVIRLENGKIAFCIADISGKGVAAGLLMSNFQANLRTWIARKELSLIEVTHQLNKKVSDITKGEKFITMFMGEYDPVTRKLTYVNAGHNPSILYNNGELIELKSGCTILGMFDELPCIQQGEVDLAPGAFVFNYTDGLTELENESGEMLEEERTKQFIEANHRLSMEAFIQALLAKIDEFRGSKSYVDDITFLACRFK